MIRLLRLVRWFGVRRGLRMWRRSVEADLSRPIAHPAGWQPVHGARPDMPGYRRRKRR